MGKIYDALKKQTEKHLADADAEASVEAAATIERDTGESELGFHNQEAGKEPCCDIRQISGQGRTTEENVSDTKGKHKAIKEGTIDQNLVMYHNPNSFEAEQFKALRTKLFFNNSGIRPKSIMVTSAVPGEGKTFVSTNLAVSIAQTINEYVLLVDCDMRHPSVGGYFGLSDVGGLSDYLSKGIPLSKLLVKPLNEKLSILTAGRKTDNPSELISSKEMTDLLSEIASRYSDRYILIDSPPPNVVAEASAIAKQVDGILLVIRYGKTKREWIQEIVKKVGKEKILGSVLNRFDIRMPSYYNGYHKADAYRKYYK